MVSVLCYSFSVLLFTDINSYKMTTNSLPENQDTLLVFNLSSFIGDIFKRPSLVTAFESKTNTLFKKTWTNLEKKESRKPG